MGRLSRFLKKAGKDVEHVVKKANDDVRQAVIIPVEDAIRGGKKVPEVNVGETNALITASTSSHSAAPQEPLVQPEASANNVPEANNVSNSALLLQYQQTQQQLARLAEQLGLPPATDTPLQPTVTNLPPKL